ncbi:MAG: [Fe-Fe] hydrogenase large subunit C-terminal domain-containing protein [Bacillota bacterium]
MEVLIDQNVKCQDCHRCIRECSINAVGVENEQAWTITDFCIYCGRCINVCPQGAPLPQDQTEIIKSLLAGSSQTALSLAPSFYANYPDKSPEELAGALRQAGFDIIAETAQGAEILSPILNQEISGSNQPVISSSCPGVVNLIEKHYPELIPNLSSLLSPALIHALHLKEKYGQEIKVIFAGPCLAKIDEALNGSSNIDYILTFQQLDKLLNESNSFTGQACQLDEYSSGRAVAYPVEKGAVKATGFNSNNGQALYGSGIDECVAILQDLKANSLDARFIELLICQGGCINGPFISKDNSIARRKQVIKNIYKKRARNDTKLEHNFKSNQLSRNYTNKKVKYPEPAESEIQEILKSIGKYSEKDETNCGGCGYDSCRDKAIAIYQGLAEAEMCIPYMKKKAESLSNIIFQSSHNAIIVVNPKMIVQEFNPVAEKLFNHRDRTATGRSLYRYLDPELFQKAWQEKRKIRKKEVAYEKYDLVTEQNIFPIEEHEVIVGIFADITEKKKRQQEVKEMKQLAAEKAEDVVHKQMKIVQQIASLLGETTVETKSALYDLTRLIQEED